MKTNPCSRLLVSLLLFSAAFISPPLLFAQGTAITYQGQLTASNAPANGSYDMTFALYNASSLGSQVGSTITTSAVGVSNGLFTVVLDFDGVFNGTSYWLQIGVRTNGVGSYSPLSPRQELTPTPYAITAENVNGLVSASQLTGTLPSGVLSGGYGNVVNLNNAGNSFTGDGTGLVNVNAASLNGLAASNFWNTTGNAGTTPGLNYLGTTDLEPLEIDVQGMRALRIEPDITYGYHIPNLVGGSPGNFVKSGTVGNVIVGGGSYNEASTNYIDAANYNFIGSGWNNHITNNTYEAVIVGGQYNTAGNSQATVGGGEYNAATGYASTVPGGSVNLAAGDQSFAAGTSATANNQGSFVWSDDSGFPTADTGANQFVVRATGGAFFYDGASGVVIDSSGSNYGTIDFGLKFGAGGGEGIASQRTAGVDQFDLSFYTALFNRMIIMNNGFVGIGTTNPVTTLEVNGNAQIDGNARITGLINSGSQTGTSQAPTEPGLVVRRINSTTATAGSIVARTDTLTLVRDGSNGGWKVDYTANPGNVTIAATGITSAGAVIGFYTSLANPVAAGSVQVFTDAQAVHSMQISFGYAFGNSHMTEANLTRYTNDYYWIGTVNSTYNQ